MKNDLDITAATKVMSKFGASKGGRARAETLTDEQRREIARNAVMTHWAKQKDQNGQPQVPKATHIGILEIGEISIPCAVLKDGTRVPSENGITNALLGSRSGASKRMKRASPMRFPKN
jgi:hypothetical protein